MASILFPSERAFSNWKGPGFKQLMSPFYLGLWLPGKVLANSWCLEISAEWQELTLTIGRKCVSYLTEHNMHIFSPLNILLSLMLKSMVCYCSFCSIPLKIVLFLFIITVCVFVYILFVCGVCVHIPQYRGQEATLWSFFLSFHLCLGSGDWTQVCQDHMARAFTQEAILTAHIFKNFLMLYYSLLQLKASHI